MRVKATIEPCRKEWPYGTAFPLNDPARIRTRGQRNVSSLYWIRGSNLLWSSTLWVIYRNPHPKATLLSL